MGTVLENEAILSDILQALQGLSFVRAIAIGGSGTNKGVKINKALNYSDYMSDIDIYIFVEKDIPVEEREKIIKKYSSKSEIGGEYFGSGDEFFVDKLNKQLDVMYWNVEWFENIVNNVWFKHYPSNGYTTAFLFTLNNFEIICDKNNWLTNIQNSIKTKYPQELKQNIIKRNMMLMKDKPFASYYEQIEKAIKRYDIVSINHRISVFLASYFDVIFALNELLHPGEKRLIKYALDNCNHLPQDFEENINKLLIQPNEETIKIIDDMIEKIKSIL